MINEVNTKKDALLNWFLSFESVMVAFSGGLDSTLVAKAAQIVCGANALAVTAWSDSGCEEDKANAGVIAQEIGIRHLLFSSREFTDLRYLQNDPERCYYCKEIRFAEMVRMAEERKFQVVVDGSNADDQFDYRPGTKAARELGIRSPLAELGIAKEMVRAIAKSWNLSNWNKPAQPCLSTRVPYDQPLTAPLLRRIDAAEQIIAALGFSPLRVRVHGENVARIEVPADQIAWLVEPLVREKIVEELRKLDFRYICVELQGFRSGSLNPVSATNL